MKCFHEFQNHISSFPESRTKSISRIPERKKARSRISEPHGGGAPKSNMTKHYDFLQFWEELSPKMILMSP